MGNLLLLGLVGLALYVQKMKNTQSISDALQDVAAQVETATGAWRIDPRGNQYDDLFDAADQKYGLPSGMMRRIAWQESRFNPNAQSPAGAQGLMQFMPATAAALGFNPFDPAASIDAAGRYFKQLYASTGNWRDAIAAYNWGIGNIIRKGYIQAPAETVQYVTSVMSDLNLA
ncbi:MAG TPA: lytic transglycosylase domain-containing protein [Candidatus Paceibacterota bacterium]